jgi:ABC-2 type transport system permease protein
VSETLSAFRAERRKLQTQLSTKLLALVCIVGPFAFAGVLSSQTASPADTLFGVWVHSSGFAVSLVVLGFSGGWGFPLIAGIIAGDIFSSEDRYGTWKMVLTRSRTREHLFAGKVLAATTFSLGLLGLLAISSTVAGVVFVGGQSLVGLSGNVISAAHALLLVIVSWILSVPPMLAFTALAMLLSVATRNGIVGVIGPSVAGLVMQLLLLIGAGVWAHAVLISSAFNIWHPLFVAHAFYGMLIVGCVVSVLWTIVCLWTAWAILRKRDFAGAPVSRGRGWVMPARITVALAAVIALFAIAGNWGPAGVTAKRVKRSFTPAFTSLTLLQQRQLGRKVPSGAKLNIQTSCSRRAATPTGPGDWACTLVVYIPQLGAVPFQQTPVTYDVSVNSDGCYKATSPPQFVGAQTMRDSHGHMVVNPLFTIYGCFDTL